MYCGVHIILHNIVCCIVLRPKSHGCLQFLAVGIHFLVFGHVRSIECCCAVLFMAFSFCRIVQFSFDFGKERHASAVGRTADTPRQQRKIHLDETETVVLELQDSPDSETLFGTPHWPSAAHFLQNHPRLRSWYETLFPAVSVAGYTVETILLVLSFFVALSGISQGVTGAGGPPRVIAYSLLDLSKGATRGLIVSVFFACSFLLYVISDFS